MYKRYWIAELTTRGFASKVLFYGTEEELHEYTESELGYIPAYSGATEKEVEAARALKIKAYLCPEVKARATA